MDHLLLAAAFAAFALIVFWPRAAAAHCDTLDGPAVADGRAALATGNLNHALKWVGEDAEPELREVFEACLRVRALGGDATTVADRLFLETLVRLHRAGEGAGFDGLKPQGTAIDPVVIAADTAIATGSIDSLIGLVPADRLPELDHRLHAALALKDHPLDDVIAGRRYIAAYVAFFTYAEGEDHGHEHGQHEHRQHEHGHGGHGPEAHHHEHTPAAAPGHAHQL